MIDNILRGVDLGFSMTFWVVGGAMRGVSFCIMSRNIVLALVGFDDS